MLFKIIFICVALRYASGQGTLTKEYKIERYFKANWFDANIFCRDHGMQLATVDSDLELRAIRDVMQQIPLTESNGAYVYDDFWISATDLAKEGYFTWFSTGKAVTYTAWAAGQPFQADPNFQFDDYGQPLPKEIYENSEDCVQIQGEYRQWGNANCTNLNYFLCERV